ncbi:MAG: hypothetical protein PHH73_00025 [Candidatus Rickettsiella isopodorum]|nr:hypothetical protein [Candidatus Rickettsiella isopodorum]
MSILAGGGSSNIEYEKVKIDEWIEGKIKDVEVEKDVKSEWKNADGEVEEKVQDKVRFIFELVGYKFSHRSKRMTISTHKKSTLYKDFLVSLFPTLKPSVVVDLEMLKGQSVKTMWDERVSDRDGKTYQYLSKIKLLGNDDGKFHIVIRDEEKEKNTPDVPF